MAFSVAPPIGLFQRPVRAGIAVSAVLHLAIVLGSLWAVPWSGPDEPRILVSAQAGVLPRHAEAEPDAAPVRIVKDTASVTGPMVTGHIESLVDRLEQAPPDEQLDRLEKMNERLEQLSSTQSLDALADQLQQWLGYDDRATEPLANEAEAAADFDFDTAQLHDVYLRNSPDNPSVYVAVLLDARGRTWEVALSEAEGAAIYELMQKIKSSPLMESIYRQIAMPLLDQMIGEARSE